MENQTPQQEFKELLQLKEEISLFHRQLNYYKKDNESLSKYADELEILLRAEINPKTDEGFLEWLTEIGFKKYAEGWCQAGGSNGWHCSTADLYPMYLKSKTNKS